MKFSHTCIERPVLATVLSLILILIGFLGYQYLHMRYMPYVFKPNISINTNYNGANAKLVEESITDPLEKSLSNVPHLDYMHSESSDGQSNIKLYFKAINESEFTVVLAQVQRAVADTQSILPEHVTPYVRTAGHTGNFIMAVAFTDPHMSQLALSNYVAEDISKEVQRVDGVGYIFPWHFNLALRINLNPEKMAMFGITLAQLRQRLDDSNAQFPVGSQITQMQMIPIDAKVSMSSINSFLNLVIQNNAGHLVRLKDIATVQLSTQTLGGTVMQMDDQPSSGLGIVSSNDANPISVGNAVKDKLKAIQVNLPPGMKMSVTFNATSYLKASVHEVFNAIFEAMILVCLVILIFLGRWRAALIPIVTIPVCLLSSFAIIYALGFTINMLTLLAMVLAVGMVVDDAIVVLENTHRHVEGGMPSVKASHQSVKEISFAVLGMTICLLAVYLPTGFMHGQTAIYFREFAFTLAASILISGFVALTLTPMMCSKLLQRHQLNRYEMRLDKVFHYSRVKYQSVLSHILKHPWRLAAVFVVLIALGFGLLSQLQSSILPVAYGPFARMFLNGPKTMNANELYRQTQGLIRKIKAQPSVEHVFIVVEDGMLFGFMRFKPAYAKNNQAVAEDVQKINALVHQVPGISGGASPINLNHHGQASEQGSFQFLVLGEQSYHKISQSAAQLVKALNETKLFSTVTNSVKTGNMTKTLQIKRQLAASLNVPLASITNALSVYFGGHQLETYYRLGNERYPIIMQLPEKELANFDILQKIYVANTSGQLLPLSRFVTVKQSLSMPTREHFNQRRAASIYANLAPGVSLSQAINAVRSLSKRILPSDQSIQFVGQARTMSSNNKSMAWIFVLGLLFIFLVLAALFESFIDPLIILMTVPVCIVGALLILWLTGSTLNTYTGVALVTLIGLVSKHGILITQFANQQRLQGVSVREAVLNAAAIRLRPILMTTLTMVLGAVPLVIASGPGYVGRMQVGIVIISGLILGTIFSLFIVPVAYCVLTKLKKA